MSGYESFLPAGIVKLIDLKERWAFCPVQHGRSQGLPVEQTVSGTRLNDLSNLAPLPKLNVAGSIPIARSRFPEASSAG